MRVAITGGIAEGKSTVLRMLGEEGFRTVSADEIAQQLDDAPDLRQEIAHIFGPHATRAEIRERILERPHERRQLNRAYHPRVVEIMEERQADFYEVPLLFEACIQNRFDQVWCVTCGPELQLKRLVGKVGDAELANRLIGLQLPSEVKCRLSHRVIRTDTSLTDVHSHISEIVQGLRAGGHRG